MAVEGGHVGTWNTGLYGNDTAADLRDDFETVARAPWDGERLLAWILERYPAAGDPSDPEYTDVRLAAADLFWRYGIDHAPTVETARAIVADGLDLAAKRTLGMTERIIARRVAVLRDLADRLQRPNASPKPRRMFDGPEAFVMDAGDVLVYPTSKGDPRNPYVGPRKEERFYAMHPWEQDGWAMAIVLLRYHRYDVFARYVVALLRVDPASKPSMERLASRTIMHAARFAVYEPRRRVHKVSTSRQHLERMRVEVIGHVALRAEAVAADFAPDRPPLAKYGERELANEAWIERPGTETEPVDDPIAPYLR
jgi:hypothetical protein